MHSKNSLTIYDGSLPDLTHHDPIVSDCLLFNPDLKELSLKGMGVTYLVLSSDQFRKFQEEVLQLLDSEKVKVVLTNAEIEDEDQINNRIIRVQDIYNSILKSDNLHFYCGFDEQPNLEDMMEFSIRYAIFQSYQSCCIVTEIPEAENRIQQLKDKLLSHGVSMNISINKPPELNGLQALVVPTIAPEVDKICSNLQVWDQQQFSPYRIIPDTPRVDLIFAYGQQPESGIVKQIQKAFINTRHVKKCFRHLKFINANLSDEENVYRQDYIGKSRRRILRESPKFGYKAGPNNVFLFIINRMSSYEYTFLMESDCEVIRGNWLGEAERIVNAHNGAWIVGSVYRGLSLLQDASRFHINGNAIYGTGLKDFRQFVMHQFKSYLTKKIKVDPVLAYDTAFIRYFHDPAHWTFAQENIHKLVYTEYIQNYSGDPTMTGGDIPNIWEIRRTSPETYMVHGKLVRQDIPLDRLKRINT